MSKQIYELLTPEHIHVEDSLGNMSFGCDQEWYGTYWKRLSGCGPTTASNILLYLHKTKNISLPLSINSRESCIKLMDEVWEYVTPTMKGVHIIDIFFEGVHAFTQAQGVTLESFSLNIPQKKAARPDLLSVVNFIKEGLKLDCPVAFLNLSNGRVRNLDKWHWVTIISLETDSEESDSDIDSVYVKIYDGAKTITVNLKLWYETTSRGGGFVYFKVK